MTSQEPLNHKTWVFKVSIHCEGCKRKVKKILQQIQGVYDIDIDVRQQRVVVTGDVHADAVLKKLNKSGKHVELWPQLVPQLQEIPATAVKKAKGLNPGSKQEDCSTSSHGGAKPSKKVAVVIQEPPAKISEDGSEESARGAVKKEESSVAAVSGGAAKVSEVGSKTKGVESFQETKESKAEGKKPETGESSSQLPAAAEKTEVQIGKSGGESGGGGIDSKESGSSGKTKKKKGQNGNSAENISSSAGPTDIGIQHHHESGPPATSYSTNHSPPRHPSQHSYLPYGPQYYGPTPVYAVSYNTAYPTINSTTSYYAAPPMNSYAYTYPGPVVEPPPSDLVQPQQPLDSFELFSDENPNGCSIM